MSTTKVCISCKLTKDEDSFERGKNTCKACRLRQHEQSDSSSPEQFLARLCSKSKSKVTTGNRPAHIDWRITVDDLVALWKKQKGRCAISGVILTHHKDGSGHKEFNASLDRISPEFGYVPENIQLVCYRVNIMKHNMTEDMLYWWVRTINDFSCK